MHVEVGEGDGPHLLLVHGFGSSRAQWRLNLPDLEQFCTPVVIELLGHGRSLSPDDPAAYTVDRYIARFEAVRSRLGLDRWMTCGQSYGAALTLRYALARPDSVARQVITNSKAALAPEFLAVSEAERHAQADAFAARGVEGMQAAAFYPRRTGRRPPAVEEEMVRDAELLSFPAMVAAMRMTMPGPSVADRLAEFAMPTLLVNGRRETDFQRLRDRAAAAIRGIEVVDLDGGHAVNMDCPTEFNAAVRAFVEGG